jgi:hypothetical protein
VVVINNAKPKGRMEAEENAEQAAVDKSRARLRGARFGSKGIADLAVSRGVLKPRENH